MIFNHIKPLRNFLLVLFFLASATISISVYSQAAYPNRPIKLITPFPPGGSSDVLARLIATKLGEGLGQTVTVDNRAGASGNIGHEAAAKSLPDGYTLLLSNSTTAVTNPHLFKKLPFDPVNDFAAISMVGSAGQVLVVHPSVPVTTLAEVTAYAKANPNKLNFGSGGKGIQSHISGEMYKSAVGVNIVHIPYKGTIQAVTDLLAGQIQMVFSDMVPAMPHIKSGKLRAIAVTSLQRSAALPDVPTMSESGLSGFDSGVWWSIVAPKGTPVEVITLWEKVIDNYLSNPKMIEEFKKESSTTYTFGQNKLKQLIEQINK